MLSSPLNLNAKFLSNPDKWPILAHRLTQAGEFGFDTETYNQSDKTSPQHRARVHCWSVGVLTGDVTYKGFRRAVGVVLPRAAMDCPDIRAVFSNSLITKWAHNAPHDYHATVNEGLEVNGMQDSLQWSRVACPGLLGYGLKDIEMRDLGYPPRPSFKDMIVHPITVVKATRKIMRGCICGTTPCKQRSNKMFIDDLGNWRHHTRVSFRKFTPSKREIEGRYAVTDFVPGANLDPLIWGTDSYDRLQSWWDYSLADAVRGMSVVDWLRRNQEKTIVFPWQ